MQQSHHRIFKVSEREREEKSYNSSSSRYHTPLPLPSSLISYPHSPYPGTLTLQHDTIYHNRTRFTSEQRDEIKRIPLTRVTYIQFPFLVLDPGNQVYPPKTVPKSLLAARISSGILSDQPSVSTPLPRLRGFPGRCARD